MTQSSIGFLMEHNLALYLMLESSDTIYSDDEPDPHEDPSQPSQPGEQQDPNAASIPTPQQDPLEIIDQEFQATEDKFLQFILYDKLGELASKIELILDNVKDDKVAEELRLIEKLEHYSQYIEVLNELIFSISTSVVYKLLGQIELELISLLQIYNANLEQKKNQEETK